MSPFYYVHKRTLKIIFARNIYTVDTISTDPILFSNSSVGSQKFPLKFFFIHFSQKYDTLLAKKKKKYPSS